MQEQFRNLYIDDEFANEIKHAVSDIIIDLNYDLMGINQNIENMVERITQEVETLSEEFKIVGKYKNEFITYILDNIFLPS